MYRQQTTNPVLSGTYQSITCDISETAERERIMLHKSRTNKFSCRPYEQLRADQREIHQYEPVFFVKDLHSRRVKTSVHTILNNHSWESGTNPSDNIRVAGVMIAKMGNNATVAMNGVVKILNNDIQRNSQFQPFERVYLAVPDQKHIKTMEKLDQPIKLLTTHHKPINDLQRERVKNMFTDLVEARSNTPQTTSDEKFIYDFFQDNDVDKISQYLSENANNNNMLLGICLSPAKPGEYMDVLINIK